MSDELVSEHVEIDPILGAATFGKSELVPVEVSGFVSRTATAMWKGVRLIVLIYFKVLLGNNRFKRSIVAAYSGFYAKLNHSFGSVE